MDRQWEVRIGLALGIQNLAYPSALTMTEAFRYGGMFTLETFQPMHVAPLYLLDQS